MLYYPLISGSIWDTLQDVSDTVVSDKLSAIGSTAVLLAAVLAAWSLIKATTEYVEGDRSWLWSFLRPIAILFIVMNFQTFCSAFNGTVGLFSGRIADACDSALTDIGKVLIDALGEGITTPYEEYTDNFEKKSFWENLIGAFGVVAKTVTNVRNITDAHVVTTIGRFIIEIVFFVFEVLAAVYLVLLRILGPFVFALAIPKVWQSGISGWIARYIQISLWMPIGYIIIAVLTATFKGVCGLMISGGIFSNGLVVGLCIVIAVVVSIFSIPKIASWVIESAGSGNAQSALERGFSAAARKII